MGDSPAFRFYPSDYLSDEKVQAMSIDGEGCYIRLLSYCWKEGSIPADRESIVKLCKGYDGPGIDEAMSCFDSASKLRKNSKLVGRLVHKRLIAEKRGQQKYRKSMKTAGLAGASKRWQGHGQAIAKGMAKDGSSSSFSFSNNIPPTPRRGSHKYEPSDIAVEQYWRDKGARGLKTKEKAK